MKTNPDRDRRTVDGGLRSVVNALDLLECFQFDEQLGVTDLAERLSIAKSSAHRLLTSLCDRGFAERDPKTGRYQLGLRLHELGQLAANRVPIRPAARPILEDLARRTGYTVHLALPDDENVIYIERIHGPGRFETMSRVGIRVPVHLCSSGKTIAAFDPLVANARRVAGFPSWTSASIHDLAGFNAALEQIRRRGFAVNAQEAVSGLTSVAAPVRNRTGRAVAAISMLATTPELEGRIESVARLATLAARRLADNLGI